MVSDQLEQGIPLLLLCWVGFAEVQPGQDTHKKSHLFGSCATVKAAKSFTRKE